MTSNNLWYKDAIIYELHVKAFKDSDGDGIGDFKGLVEKLDYLEDLGVTAIWLLPFYPSPLRDDGYDILDYYSINPSYGNLRSLKKVIREAHKRNLKIITELVINHTSDQHPWFQRARKSPKGSNYRDYYVWSDHPDKYQDARIIFTDYEKSNWSWDPEAHSYYWHRFFHHQPDLNFDNPSVQNEIMNILDFWIDLGVDGFRLDAVPYLFEREGTNCENLDETHQFLKRLRKYVDDKYDGIMFLAEANMWPEDSVSYFGNGDECHMNYHFPIMPRLFMSIKMEDRHPIIDIIDQTPEIPENCQWAIFLRNHDELTLEMVTDEERDYMYKVYTKDPQARINLGIRHRLAPLLDNNMKKIELLNTLLFSLPGTPVLYYGDEIGMGDNFYLGDRDGVRTPMQWSPDRNAGFSDTNPQRLYLPVIIDPEYNFSAVNVETQQGNTSSLLWWMKRTISMRKKFKAFSRGDITFLSPNNPKVLAFIRSYEDERVLVIANLSRYSQALELDLEQYKGCKLVEVFSQNSFPTIKNDNYSFTLNPYGYFWFTFHEEETIDDNIEKIPEIFLKKWEELEKNNHKNAIENYVLPQYLRRVRWLRKAGRNIQSVTLNHVIGTNTELPKSAIFIFDINYDEGLPEMYFLPTVYISNLEHETWKNIEDRNIVSKIDINGDSGALIESWLSTDYRDWLFNGLMKRKKITHHKVDLIFNSVLEKKKLSKIEEKHSALINRETNNVTINYFDKYVLKVFRRLDDSLNPDLEINKFLSKNLSFPNIPTYKGSVEIKINNKKEIPVAMLQEYVPNMGNAWDNIVHSLKGVYERLEVHLEQENKINLEPTPQLKDTENLSEEWVYLLGGDLIDRIQLLGKRSAELHLALSNQENSAFRPEAFSLHYQRSLFSSLQTLTRTAMQSLKKQLRHFNDELAEEAKMVLDSKKFLLDKLKRIYARKLDGKKIRNHGDLQLSQVLWTGKDFVFIDFEGDIYRPFSERRLKRSPVRDVASMQRSIHYATYQAFIGYDFAEFDDERLPKWAESLKKVLSNLFLSPYLKTLSGANLIPDDEEDYEILETTFVLERILWEIKSQNFENPNWFTVPIKGIKTIINE